MWHPPAAQWTLLCPMSDSMGSVLSHAQKMEWLKTRMGKSKLHSLSEDCCWGSLVDESSEAWFEKSKYRFIHHTIKAYKTLCSHQLALSPTLFDLHQIVKNQSRQCSLQIPSLVYCIQTHTFQHNGLLLLHTWCSSSRLQASSSLHLCRWKQLVGMMSLHMQHGWLCL